MYMTTVQCRIGSNNDNGTRSVEIILLRLFFVDTILGFFISSG